MAYNCAYQITEEEEWGKQRYEKKKR